MAFILERAGNGGWVVTSKDWSEPGRIPEMKAAFGCTTELLAKIGKVIDPEYEDQADRNKRLLVGIGPQEVVSPISKTVPVAPSVVPNIDVKIADDRRKRKVSSRYDTPFASWRVRSRLTYRAVAEMIGRTCGWVASVERTKWPETSTLEAFKRITGGAVDERSYSEWRKRKGLKEQESRQRVSHAAMAAQ